MTKYYVKVGLSLESWHKNPTRPLLHRIAGPAESNSAGGECWMRSGRFHRSDGPAVTYTDGYESYWLDGVQYTKDEYVKILCESQ